jgi:hypothetical protein
MCARSEARTSGNKGRMIGVVCIIGSTYYQPLCKCPKKRDRLYVWFFAIRIFVFSS